MNNTSKSKRASNTKEPKSKFITDISGGQVRTVVNAAGDVLMPQAVNSSALSALYQLPPPPNDFTGREADLDELISSIEHNGVAISGLKGMGGIGKTALALTLAHRLGANYPDGQFFLDLRGDDRQTALSPTQAMSHVIRSYNWDRALPDNDTELAALYYSVLNGKRALLLMDNALDDRQVAPLIPPVGCLLLVTTRQHFNLPGLYAKRIDKMTHADARELLLKITPRVGSQADALADVCGYLPLALRLAANALAKRVSLSPAEYLKRLNKSQEKLQLIDAAISLSYKMLTRNQQKLWCQLSVFRGVFGRSSAESLWGIQRIEAGYNLDEMVSYSLVDWQDTARSYSLHDLVRVFADAQMSDEERVLVRRRRTAPAKEPVFKQQRSKMVKTLEPRAREAVEYLLWQKKQIDKACRYRVSLEGKETIQSLEGLEVVWESFVDILSIYARLGEYSTRYDRFEIEKQIGEIKSTLSNPDISDSSFLRSDLPVLHERLRNLDKVRGWKKQLEPSLMLTENFFALLASQAVIVRTGGRIERVEGLLESFLETVLSELEITKDSLNEIMTEYESLP